MTTAAGNYYYGLGRRKTAIARVRLYPGNGQITVNGSRPRSCSSARNSGV